MRKKIERKLEQIEFNMKRIEGNRNFPYIDEDWKSLNAQRQVLAELLLEFPERKKKEL